MWAWLFCFGLISSKETSIIVHLYSLVGTLAPNRQFQLTNTPLQTNQILLQLRFFLLKRCDLILEFQVFLLLRTEVAS